MAANAGRVGQVVGAVTGNAAVASAGRQLTSAGVSARKGGRTAQTTGRAMKAVSKGNNKKAAARVQRLAR